MIYDVTIPRSVTLYFDATWERYLYTFELKLEHRNYQVIITPLAQFAITFRRFITRGQAW